MFNRKIKLLLGIKIAIIVITMFLVYNYCLELNTKFFTFEFLNNIVISNEMFESIISFNLFPVIIVIILEVFLSLIIFASQKEILTKRIVSLQLTLYLLFASYILISFVIIGFGELILFMASFFFLLLSTKFFDVQQMRSNDFILSFDISLLIFLLLITISFITLYLYKLVINHEKIEEKASKAGIDILALIINLLYEILFIYFIIINILLLEILLNIFGVFLILEFDLVRDLRIILDLILPIFIGYLFMSKIRFLTSNYIDKPVNKLFSISLYKFKKEINLENGKNATYSKIIINLTFIIGILTCFIVLPVENLKNSDIYKQPLLNIVYFIPFVIGLAINKMLNMEKLKSSTKYLKKVERIKFIPYFILIIIVLFGYNFIYPSIYNTSENTEFRFKASFTPDIIVNDTIHGKIIFNFPENVFYGLNPMNIGMHFQFNTVIRYNISTANTINILEYYNITTIKYLNNINSELIIEYNIDEIDSLDDQIDKRVIESNILYEISIICEENIELPSNSSESHTIAWRNPEGEFKQIIA